MSDEDEVVDLRELRRTFEALTPALTKALSTHVMDFAIGLQSYAIQHYMIDGHPLHQRSGNLIKALNVAPLKTTEHEVSTSVGDNIEYAKVHELGGTFEIPAHVRLMSPRMASALGYDVPKGYRLETMVRAHTATYPKRAFLAPSLADNSGKFHEEMEAAAREAVNEATNGSA